ncbi:MAG: helix-turn-helix transcriptional regulator [Clostridia bacterium]|nr:helix-turn-helix transcriptional regulator [Clostridia bacterium]
MDNHTTPYANVIRTYRLLIPLTSEELAQRLSVRPTTVNEWESGRRRPNLMQIPVLCAVLGITYEQFFGVSRSARRHPPKKYIQMTFAPVLSNYVIATVRRKRGLSEEDFAKAIGILPREVALLESGKKIPTLEQIPRICSVLHIRIKRFFE